MSFFDFFPTPRFLLLSDTGIVISDKFIQIAEFREAHGSEQKFSLVSCGEALLPPGAVVSGAILNQEEVVRSLQGIKERYHLNFVHATLPEEKAYLFVAEFDRMPLEDLRDAVAFVLEENVPLTLAESIFYFDVINPSAKTSKMKVAVSVLQEKDVKVYVDTFESAGITPVSFDIESQAIARALILEGDTRTQLILNIQETKTGLYVVEDEVVQFSSTPSLGSRTNESGYVDLANLKSEIRKLFSFWKTHLDKQGIPQGKIERVLLVGEGASKEDFVTELMSGIDAPYALADVWANAFSIKKHLPEVPFETSLSYGAAIGAALPDKEHIYV